MAPNGPRSDARKRAAEAYRLRCTGRTWDEIARATGFKTHGSAFNAVKNHIKRMPAEDQELARAFSAGTYRHVIARLTAVGTRAEGANKLTTAVQAYEAAANVQAKHDQLTGVQAPVTKKVDVQVTSAVAVIDTAEEQLRAILAARVPQIAIPAAIPAVIDAEVVVES